jgi:hypothetical protein
LLVTMPGKFPCANASRCCRCAFVYAMTGDLVRDHVAFVPAKDRSNDG